MNISNQFRTHRSLFKNLKFPNQFHTQTYFLIKFFLYAGNVHVMKADSKTASCND